MPESTLDYLSPWFRTAAHVLESSNSGMTLWPDKVRVLPRGLRLQSPPIAPDVHAALYGALLDERQVTIRYQQRHAAEPKDYLVHPLGVNVDGQFQKDGFDPLRIDECHGSIHHLQCMLPCSPSIWGAATFDLQVDADRCAMLGAMPACPHCDGIARPNILMFDDWHWIETRRQAQAARRQSWLDRVSRPVVIELGAGVNVATVRHFAHRIVRQHNGELIRINPREAQVGTLPGVGIAAGALQALSAIGAVLGSRSR